MYVTDNNLSRVSETPPVRPAVTSREVELGSLRFAIHIQRVLEKINIESGPGLRLIEHMEESADAITTAIEKAAAQRNPAKAGKYYSEVSQHVTKILHWLRMIENSGAIPPKDLNQIRDCGGAISVSLAAICPENAGKAKHKHPSLREDLSDI